MHKKLCCVPGCLQSTGSQNVLHKFPNPEKERDRFNLWLMAIGGEIMALSNEIIYKNRRVCHAHFEEKYCCRFDRISNISVPTMQIPDPLSLPSVQISTKQRVPLRQLQQDDIRSLPSTSRVSAPAGKENQSESHQDCQETGHPLNPLISAVSAPDVSGMETKSETVQDFQETSYPLISAAAKTQKIKKKLLTKPEHEFLKTIKRLRTNLSKYKSKIKKQSVSVKAAKNIMQNPDFLKTLEDLPNAAKLLTIMQFREVKKKHKGRRFTCDEKVLALSLLKQSPKAYKFLSKILILPAPQTLVKLIKKANIRPGINKKIFDQLKKKAEKMKTEEKLCVLLFDEMALKSNVIYNERKDKIIGLVTNGEETKLDFADHAQVFMMRGLMKNYKQPISYTFSQAATKGPELAQQVKANILALQKAGFVVVATICDQGTNNCSAIKHLLQETKTALLKQDIDPNENVIIINNQKIVPLYDPPHLLKCIRNNLLTKDLIYTIENNKGTAKWSHLELLHKENPGYKGMRLIPKLTDSHVISHKIPKMKVKYASQIFSKTVGNNMGYLADKNIIPRECKETADLLLFFDDLFDSMNGSYKKKGSFAKPLLGPAKPTSPHHKMWQKSREILKNMRFIGKVGKFENVPTLKNWAWTLDGIQILLKYLETTYHITSIWMRHLNQDPIENFFGAIRSHGCRNNNPTSDSFESAYTTLLINNLSSAHALGANCEKDNCDTLHSLIITEECNAPKTPVYVFPDINLMPLEEKTDPRIMAPLQYVSGYMVRQAKRKIFKNCPQCKIDFLNTNEIEYIKYRNYTGKSWLCTPSNLLILCLSNVQDVIHEVLKYNLHANDLKMYIKTIILMMIDFDFIKCINHKDNLIDFLINLACRFFVHNHCKKLNRIMCGKRNCDDVEDCMEIKAKKCFMKMRKK